MKKIFNLLPYILLLLIIALFFFNKKEPSNNTFEDVLALSGENRIELEKVINHFKNDSLKFKATCFLIENMINNGSLEYDYIRSGCLTYIDSTNVDSVESDLKAGNSYFKAHIYKRDLSYITSAFLIENIDLSFEVWETYSWCRELSFDDFCRKILPYRIANEPLTNWRKHYYLAHKQELDSLNTIGASQSQVCFFLNERYLKKYIKSASVIKGDFSYQKFEKLGGGTCGHLAHNAVMLMRACGVPLNFDILAYHGRINGGHIYNSLDSCSSSDFIFFSPYDRAPERRSWRAHRIMRLNYDYNKLKIFDEVEDINDIPQGILQNAYLTDVTVKYFPIKDVTIQVSKKITNKILFLCTYNRGQFKTVSWGKVKHGKVLFENLTKELLYFPMVYDRRKLSPILSPFVLRNDGTIVTLAKSIVETNISDAYLSIVSGSITIVNKAYKLYYWDNNWVYFGTSKATKNRKLSFENVPSETLYLLKGDKGNELIQRPFSYINDSIEGW